MAKCGRCKRPIEFGSRCENCKTKDLADRIKKRELKGLDNQSQKDIKSLGLQKEKLSPIFRNYSTYATNYKKLFKVTPSFDDYLTALRNEKIKLAHKEADRIKREHNRKTSIFPDENYGKPVNVEFDHQGDINPIEPIIYPETKQYPKKESSLNGANAFHELSESSEEPRPQSNQQRLKGLFGSFSE